MALLSVLQDRCGGMCRIFTMFFELIRVCLMNQ